MPHQIFEQIQNIRDSIPIGDEETAWKNYDLISHSLEQDPRASGYEKECLALTISLLKL